MKEPDRWNLIPHHIKAKIREIMRSHPHYFVPFDATEFARRGLCASCGLPPHRRPPHME